MGRLIYALAMPPFIVTLAGMFLMRGVAYMLTIDSVPINHGFYDMLGKAYWLMPGKGRLTLIGVAMLAVVAVGMLVAHRTRFGAAVFALVDELFVLGPDPPVGLGLFTGLHRRDQLVAGLDNGIVPD